MLFQRLSDVLDKDMIAFLFIEHYIDKERLGINIS